MDGSDGFARLKYGGRRIFPIEQFTSSLADIVSHGVTKFRLIFPVLVAAFFGSGAEVCVSRSLGSMKAA